jgi:hypothetical protein
MGCWFMVFLRPGCGGTETRNRPSQTGCGVALGADYTSTSPMGMVMVQMVDRAGHGGEIMGRGAKQCKRVPFPPQAGR